MAAADELADALGLREHPGYQGMFTTNEAPGAMPNKTRILKKVMEEGDATPIGCPGTVLGSLSHPDLGVLYFVEWDWKSGVAVGVQGYKIEAA